MNNFDRWMQVFEETLKHNAETKKYPWFPAKFTEVLAKFKEVFTNGNYNKEDPSIKDTCKKLGINSTYKDINEFLKSSI